MKKIKTETRRVTLPAEMVAWLNRRAKLHGQTLSETIAEVLTPYFKARPKTGGRVTVTGDLADWIIMRAEGEGKTPSAFANETLRSALSSHRRRTA